MYAFIDRASRLQRAFAAAALRDACDTAARSAENETAVRTEVAALRTELAEWGRRLKEVWAGRAHDLIDLALVDTVRNYPELAIEPFEDMIKGMVMDLDQNRFETFDELYLYCYRVAGTVGLMTMPIMGTAPGKTYEQALEPALALGRRVSV